MTKLEKFKEQIPDNDLFTDFGIDMDLVHRRGSSPEHLCAIMNEVLEILQKETNCLTVRDVHTRFVGTPRNAIRLEKVPNFWAGFDKFVLEIAVLFLVENGWVKLEGKVGRHTKIETKMITGCHEDAQVGVVFNDGGFWMGQTNKSQRK